MLHTTRKWGVSPCEPEELVTKLKDYTWTLCSAFQTPAGTIWANDSTSPDAIQEYAVLRPDGEGDFKQIETITVDWCKATKLQNYIEEYDAEGCKTTLRSMMQKPTRSQSFYSGLSRPRLLQPTTRLAPIVHKQQQEIMVNTMSYSLFFADQFYAPERPNGSYAPIGPTSNASARR